MNLTVTKSELSRPRRELLELLQRINFGRLEDLKVVRGEPVFDSPPHIVREHKFAAENGPRVESTLPDFALKEQHLDLIRLLDSIGSGTISLVTVKHGLPFSAELPG